jgi:hypothetical protein
VEPGRSDDHPHEERHMKIAIIVAVNVGSALGEGWRKRGHDVV